MSLRQEEEFESDQLIYPIIKLQRLNEEAYELYQLERSQNSRTRLHIHAQRFVAHLEDWKSTLPKGLHHSGTSPLCLLKILPS